MPLPPTQKKTYIDRTELIKLALFSEPSGVSKILTLGVGLEDACLARFMFLPLLRPVSVG